MWVYTGREVEPRQKLGVGHGFWFDFWLFLHADETHGIWACRPIGLESLIDISRTLNPTIDRTLSEAIAQELERYQRLAPYIDPQPPSSAAAIKIKIGKGFQVKIADDWREWIQTFETPSSFSKFLSNLRLNLLKAVEDADLNKISFLSRRLSSELSSSISSQRTLLRKAKYVLVNDASQSFADALAYVIEPPTKSQFVVRFAVAPVRVSRRLAQIQRGPSIRLVVDEFKDPTEDGAAARLSQRLVGVEVQVLSYDHEQAAIAALKDCRDQLHQLRVRHYVRSHLTGAVCVMLSGQPPVWLALQQPFWSQKSGRRQVPQLPPRFHRIIGSLGQDEQIPWNAMRWHLSQAIGYWAEDIHSAASEVWQALEGFCEGKSSVADDIGLKYVNRLPGELLEYLATRVSFQWSSYDRATGKCDWYYRDPAKVSTGEWLDRIFHEASTRHFRNWKKPTAPPFLFDPAAGVLTTMYDQYCGKLKSNCLIDRVLLDFDHLYGVRNAVVHKGARVGTDRWVSYLGRVGLEALLSVTSTAADEIAAKSGTARLA
jgi:hypothetical protein